MESAAKKAREIKEKNGHGSNQVHKIKKQGSQSSSTIASTSSSAKLCSRCGRGKHSREQCKFKHAVCHSCGKVGHISPVYRAKTTTNSKQSNKWLTMVSDNDHTVCEVEPLYTISDHSSCSAYQVELKVNNKPIIMEIDTGAGVSLVSESMLKALLPKLQVKRSTVQLKTYTGAAIPVKGAVTVDVAYGRRTYRRMDLLVVQGEGPCLIGRNWLSKIPLNWKWLPRS